MDRFIPRYASKRAYEATNFLKSFNIDDFEIVESSSSDGRLSSPEFFNDLRSTGNYDYIGSLEHQLDIASSSESARSNGSSISSTLSRTRDNSTDNNTNNDNNVTNNNTRQRVMRHLYKKKRKRKRKNHKKNDKQPVTVISKELRRHRQFMASYLGFKDTNRVFIFDEESKVEHSSYSPHKGAIVSNDDSFLKVDPLISFLQPIEARFYIASTMPVKSDFSVERSAEGSKNSKVAKSHIPYRVLDAPCLRNDFYSNLVSWSKTTGNVIVGLGYSVYIWSEIDGAIPVLGHNYLSCKHDLITCLSFCPHNDLFLVGTKQGRIMLFDQNKCLENYRSLENKQVLLPLTEYQSPVTKGICCVEWSNKPTQDIKYLNSLVSFFVGEESGEVAYIEIKPIDENMISWSIEKHVEELQLYCVNKFQAQSQQVCGMFKFLAYLIFFISILNHYY